MTILFGYRLKQKRVSVSEPSDGESVTFRSTGVRPQNDIEAALHSLLSWYIEELCLVTFHGVGLIVASDESSLTFKKNEKTMFRKNN